MNSKKSLENRIRGWLPTTPTLPRRQTRTPILQNPERTFYPPPPPFENKLQRDTGIFIGFGIGMFLIGLVGALFTNLTYGEVQRFVSYDGLGPNNIFGQLIDQTALLLAVAVGGIFFSVLGVIFLKSQTFKEAYVNKEKHFLGNFLFGFGGGLIILSFRFLFLFLLTPNVPLLSQGYSQLEFFIGIFAVGTCLFATGIKSWKPKN
jgi:uncharacterized membrane protein